MTSVQCLQFLIIVGLAVPVVFCRNVFKDYYMHKYHKGSSTTESSTSDSLTTDAQVVSTSDASSVEDELSSSEESSSDDSISLLHADDFNNRIQTLFIMRVAIIVSTVIFLLIVLGCVVCCCPKCCRGRERRGYIVGDNREDHATEAQPQQPLVTQLPPSSHHFPPNYAQDMQQLPPPYPQQPVQQYLPQYQQQPVPQQYSPQYQQQAIAQQYSPIQPQYPTSPTTVQFYNPPEAPPSYEDTSSHKY